MVGKLRKGKGWRAMALTAAVAFSVFSQTAVAGERRGAMLSVHKKDGQVVKGELIAVKQDSLLLLDSSSGADASVGIPEISAVRIVKKSKAWPGLGYGALAGALAGGIAGLSAGDDPAGWISFKAEDKALFFAVTLGVVSGLIGLLVGAAAGTDKEISFEGLNDRQIRYHLEDLRQRARMPDSR